VSGRLPHTNANLAATSPSGLVKEQSILVARLPLPLGRERIGSVEPTKCDRLDRQRGHLASGGRRATPIVSGRAVQVGRACGLGSGRVSQVGVWFSYSRSLVGLVVVAVVFVGGGGAGRQRWEPSSVRRGSESARERRRARASFWVGARGRTEEGEDASNQL
jgi:hypothetical protein